MLWLNLVVWSFAVIVVLAVALSLYGASRWNAATHALCARLESTRSSGTLARFDGRDLEGLPAPVQRYFNASLTNGQPLIAAVSLEHSGTFNIHEMSDHWKPFTSTQRVITRRPGFVWDRKVMMMPGLAARVHDAYAAGEGILHATILGLFSVADLRGTSDIAQGELMRFLAESAWYPTSLLTRQGVQWEGVNERSAKANLNDNGVSVTMLFRFSDDGLIASVRAEARGRAVAGKIIPTPWEARVWNYELRNGMRVPTHGEVAWMLPEGPRPYWRGQITRVEYEFAN